MIDIIHSYFVEEDVTHSNHIKMKNVENGVFMLEIGTFPFCVCLIDDSIKLQRNVH